MRRIVMLLAVGAMVLGGVASPAGGSVGDGNFVKGKASHLGADAPFPKITVRIFAFSDENDGHPHGLITLRSHEGQSRRGKVTCLHVDSNAATIGIKITKAEDDSYVGKGELFKVVDNPDGPDEIAGFPITDAVPRECPGLQFSVPVISGDYQVFDVTP
jgi:hypothetical protein